MEGFVLNYSMKEIIINSKKHGQKSIKISDEDYDYVSQFRWYVWETRGIFYARRSERDRKIYMHRDILKPCNSKIKIDHEDHDGLNNQRSNIRVASHHQNMANQSNKKGSISKYRGVVFDTRSNNWTVNLSKLGKRYYVGKFKTQEDAALAYNIKAKEVHGEFAYQNIIQ